MSLHGVTELKTKIDQLEIRLYGLESFAKSTSPDAPQLVRTGSETPYKPLTIDILLARIDTLEKVVLKLKKELKK